MKLDDNILLHDVISIITNKIKQRIISEQNFFFNLINVFGYYPGTMLSAFYKSYNLTLTIKEVSKVKKLLRYDLDPKFNLLLLTTE